MATVFDLDAIKQVLSEEAVHTYEGTCELCNFADRKLSDVGGALICDKCRNTIAKNIKETNHPFTEARATMDWRLRGQGQPGEKRRLFPHTSTPPQFMRPPSVPCPECPTRLVCRGEGYCPRWVTSSLTPK